MNIRQSRVKFYDKKVKTLENITAICKYALNNRALKYRKQHLKDEIDKLIISGDFSSPLSVMDQNRQKIHKKVEEELTL